MSVEQDKQALATLKKAKALLDKHLVGKQDFYPELDNIFADMLAEGNTDIRLYKDQEEYSVEDGKVLIVGERLSHAPIRIFAKSSLALFYYYNNGSYDIDQDIEWLEQYLRTERS